MWVLHKCQGKSGVIQCYVATIGTSKAMFSQMGNKTWVKFMKRGAHVRVTGDWCAWVVIPTAVGVQWWEIWCNGLNVRGKLVTDVVECMGLQMAVVNVNGWGQARRWERREKRIEMEKRQRLGHGCPEMHTNKEGKDIGPQLPAFQQSRAWYLYCLSPSPSP
jgi:hypothetical protein